MPNVPTVAESGFKEFEADIWFGLVAPAKTPADAISQLAAWFTAALQDPEVTPKLTAQGLVSGRHLRRRIRGLHPRSNTTTTAAPSATPTSRHSKPRAQCASGSGRNWSFTARGRFSLPPSRWNMVRLP